MSKGPKWFSDEEKQELREKLCHECELSWRISGYKKTSISELTKSVGVSTGAFYSLFPSKEELFVRTIISLRERIKRQIENIISNKPNKDGVCEAIRYLFSEYNDNPFLYDFSSPDYLALISKLSKERWAEIQKDNIDFLNSVIERSNCKLSVSPLKAHSILATLLYTVSAKDRITGDYFQVFDFLLESAIEKLLL